MGYASWPVGTFFFFFFLNRGFFHPGFLWIASLVFAFIHSLLIRDVVLHRKDTTPASPGFLAPAGCLGDACIICQRCLVGTHCRNGWLSGWTGGGVTGALLMFLRTLRNSLRAWPSHATFSLFTGRLLGKECKSGLLLVLFHITP